MTGGRAIILGPSGRNFAAGMSGGIAFVLDQHNTFRSKCNMESVDILSVEREDDLTWLYDTLTDFKNRTGSTIAAGLLEDWPANAIQLVKVHIKRNSIGCVSNLDLLGDRFG